MNILSIQSHVAFGHVGNAAATFPLQRMGVEVWPIHTVQFSNHTGYGSWSGQVFDATLIGEVVDGIRERGVLVGCDGVLSGYMGSAETGAAVLDAVATVKRANPSAKYCCDPVIGDVGRGIFVREGIPEFMRSKALPVADIVTPNQFELDYLSGRTSKSMDSTRDAVMAVHDLGPRAILVTSLHTQDTPQDCIDMLASDESGIFSVRTPKLALSVNGAGDAVAAIFFAHYLRDGNIAEALARAASAIFGILSKTLQSGAREIQLVNAQEEIVNPGRMFAAEKVLPRHVPPAASRKAEASSFAEVPSVFHVDRLELSFVPKPWAYANEHRTEIESHFEELRRAKPALWNGRVLLMHHQKVERGVLRGQSRAE